MKLIIAIISEKDAKECTGKLMKDGFSVTKLASTGGFLKLKTATIMVGAISERIPLALDVIKKTCVSRKFANRHTEIYEYEDKQRHKSPEGEIIVGGATVFVMNIEEMHKL